MARWAKVSGCISASTDYASLFADNPKAAAVFLMCLPHADPYGLLPGDPDVFVGLVCPKLRIRNPETLLDAMERAGVIERYADSRGHPLVWVRKYHEHQTVNWERVGPPESELPPDWALPEELVSAVSRPMQKDRRGASLPLRQWLNQYTASPGLSLTVTDSPGLDALQRLDVRLQTTDYRTEEQPSPPSAGADLADAGPALLNVESAKPKRRKETPEQAAIRRAYEALTGKGLPKDLPGYNTAMKLVTEFGIPLVDEWASSILPEAQGVPEGAGGWAYFKRSFRDAMNRPWEWRPKPANAPVVEKPAPRGWPADLTIPNFSRVLTDEEIEAAARLPDGEYYNLPFGNVNGTQQGRLTKTHRQYQRDQENAG